MAYQHILVIGGSGFIGTQVVAQLVRHGVPQITVPSRRDQAGKHLRVMPAVRTVSADVHDEASLNGLLAGVDAVINLAGILHSRAASDGHAYGPDFARVHVALPQKIVAACLRQGVPRLIHVSALGAAAQAPSMYLRSKADGEAAVLGHPGLITTVLRPSVVFGEQDRFLNLFAVLQKYLPLLLLGGAAARFQPVFVGDVAQVVVTLLQRQIGAGKIYELAGPQIYSLRQLVRLAGEYAGHARPLIGLPPLLAGWQAFCLEHLPGPLMSRDNLASMLVDNVATAPMAAELGIVPTALEQVAPRYLGGVNAQQQLDAYRRSAHR